jgi:hypothetical protein
MMRRTTYEAAWRLLEMIGNNRGPMLACAAAEFRSCLLREQEPKESRPPAENPYFHEASLNFGTFAPPEASSGCGQTGDD